MNIQNLESGNSNMNIQRSTGDGVMNFCLKFFIWSLIMFFIFPITFCDLYYAYNDSTCVNEPAGRLEINLYNYLMVNGWISICFIIILTIMIIFYNPNTTNDQSFFTLCGGGIITILSTLLSIFGLIWNIFGAIIFWGLMDTSKCSDSIYNYVFASLIIKFVIIIIGQLNNNNKKKIKFYLNK